MKKLILMTMTVAALGGTCNSQCFSLWPFSSNKPDSNSNGYDLTELKSFLSGRDVQFNDQRDTLIVNVNEICSPEGYKFFNNTIEWLKSLPFVTEVVISYPKFEVKKLPIGIMCGSSERIVAITLEPDTYVKYKSDYVLQK